MSDDLGQPLGLAPTQALVDELARRCTSIVLLCQFQVSAGQTVELTRWSVDEYRALGLVTDLQSRIAHSLAQDRHVTRSLKDAEDTIRGILPAEDEPDGD